MKIALIPVNPVVGDFSGNLERAVAAVTAAERAGANLAVLPELALIGYPPQDIVLRTSYAPYAATQLDAFAAAVAKIARRDDFAVVAGTALASPAGDAQPLINAAVFLHGKRRETRAKSLIPHYDIFHERRYFESALKLEPSFRAPIEFLGERFGVLVCEDSWHETVKYGRKLYSCSPSQALVEQGATFLVNISASPFNADKWTNRRQAISATARALKVPKFYVNLCGANDEIVFDGDAFCIGADGNTVAENRRFQEEMLLVDSRATGAAAGKVGDDARIAGIHAAIVLGIRDYARKNGFKSAVLGLSGGIDSAVVAALAVDALGPANVFGLTLPSKHSSAHSLADAETLARNLGMKCQNLSIKFLQSTFELALKPFFAGKPEDLTEENLQARLRGIALMAMANKFGHLLLATGNKSELAVGYSTLYGDMCGGLAPIGDLFKTDVYALAKFLNRERERIPSNSIAKAPSAELKPGQTDQDTLPPYSVLDRILHFLVERELSFAECAAALKAEGLSVDDAVLRDMERRVWANEFKRNQFAPILRTSDKAFGIGRRYPLTKRIPEFPAER